MYKKLFLLFLASYANYTVSAAAPEFCAQKEIIGTLNVITKHSGAKKWKKKAPLLTPPLKISDAAPDIAYVSKLSSPKAAQRFAKSPTHENAKGFDFKRTVPEE